MSDRLTRLIAAADGLPALSEESRKALVRALHDEVQRAAKDDLALLDLAKRAAEERAMPAAATACQIERQVIGCMILDAKLADPIRRLVGENDFVDTVCLAVFKAASKCRALDGVIIAEQARQDGLEDAPAAVAEMVGSVATSANWRYYCLMVRRASLERERYMAACELMRLAVENTDVVEWLRHLKRTGEEIAALVRRFRDDFKQDEPCQERPATHSDRSNTCGSKATTPTSSSG